MKIYNSLTRKKEAFKPIKPGKVGLYVCGVTVYDECHLGHARSAYTFDVIARYLRFRGYGLKFVRNVTDVDDKIIDKARAELKSQKPGAGGQDLKERVKEVAHRYLEMYYRDMRSLGIENPDVEPKATEHIDEMIKAIQTLIKRGYAYRANGSVYFSVRKFKDYGKLSRQSLLQMRSGARVDVDKSKKDPLDFALWKEAKPDEPSWESPFGAGRPGWHIECSVMSAKYLGDNFDIHAGGLDLIFPHHENEIAQSRSLGKNFANYWIHNGLLTINGQKMAKSLGNFITIAGALKDHHPEALKIFFLSTHYSSPIDFTFEKLTEAQTARQRFYVFFDRVDRLSGELRVKSKELRVKEKKKEALSFEIADEHKDRFVKAMDGDFNTPKALGCLFDLVGIANKFMESKEGFTPKDVLLLAYVKSTVQRLGGIFGLFAAQPAGKGFENLPSSLEVVKPSSEERLVEFIVRLRSALRERKAFDLSDSIRKELGEIGIILEDEKEKTTWRKAR